MLPGMRKPMRSYALMALLALAGAALTGCEHTTDPVLTFLAGESSKTGAMPTRFNWNGPLSTATVQETIVARTQEEWAALWKRVQQPMPALLPDGKMAVAVLLGERQGTGYGVEIVSTDRTQKLGQIDTLTVVYREYAPTGDQIKANEARGITSPWAIRLTDNWPYAPVFQHQNSTVQNSAAWQQEH